MTYSTFRKWRTRREKSERRKNYWDFIKRGIMPKQLAEETNLDVSSISRILNGKQ